MPKKDGLSVKGPMMATTHGLYFRPDQLEIVPDSPLAKLIDDTMAGLLERFPSPPPLAAVALAKIVTYKLIRAASFQAYVLQSGEAPAPTADANYLHLTGSIRADLSTLWGMNKDCNAAPDCRGPSLEEYLAALKEAKDEKED